MQFEYPTDVFSLYPEVFVHAVSCTGLGHDPCSKKIKKVWPLYFAEYTRRCLRGHLKANTCEMFPISALFGTRFIALLTVREHWKDTLTPSSLAPCVHLLLEECAHLGVKSVAFPSFGPFLDGFIKDLFLKHRASHHIQSVLLYTPRI